MVRYILFYYIMFLLFTPFIRCVDEGGTIGQGKTNNPPVADAGADLSVYVGVEVLLDGSMSYDPDGDTITFHWEVKSKPEDSGVVTEDIVPNNSEEAEESAITLDSAGSYLIQLVVSDGELNSAPDFLGITAYEEAENLPPIADAGDDLTVNINSLATLDGSGSYDPEGMTLNFKWNFDVVPSDSTITNSSFIDGDSPTPSFTPDVIGVYLISLVVNDGLLDSSPDYVVVNAVLGNQPPVADAGYDQMHGLCEVVNLDGSGSYDPDGDPITYDWAVYSSPPGSYIDTSDLSDPTVVNPYFTPTIEGDYVLSLVVSDGALTSIPDYVTIYVRIPADNELPVAEAGPDISYSDTALCTPSGYTYDCDSCPSLEIALDGSASYDPEGGVLTEYFWFILSGTGTLSSHYDVSTTLTIPEIDASYGQTETSVIEVSLMVKDCYEWSYPDTITVTYNCTGI